MTIKKIQQQIDLFRNLINQSYELITEGHFVDIPKLDINVNHLFNQIKDQSSDLSKTEIGIIMVSVETLLSNYDSLEKALNKQYSSLSAETKAWPNIAIVAYQN